MEIRGFAAAVLLMICALGCRDEQVDVSGARSVPAQPVAPRPAPVQTVEEAGLPPAPTKPQPKLPTLKLFIGTNELTAEIASRLHEITTGMMWRTNMAEMEGMLFVFPEPDFRSFWMRNTLLPLSCAYIDPQGVILELHDMKPRDLTGIKSSSNQIQYVLEVNQGWFQRHDVSLGMTVTTAHGSLSKTFFRR